MKKKFVSVLFLVTMTVGCIGACGKSEISDNAAIDQEGNKENVSEDSVSDSQVSSDDGKESNSEATSDSQVTDDGEATSDSEAVSEKYSANTDFNYDEQVQLVFDHSQWLSFNKNVSYAFCDMDKNGRMEVIVCEQDENGESAPPKVYEVTPEFDDVKECSFESNCYIYGIDKSACEGAYINPKTGTRSYLMRYEEEYMGDKLFYYYELVLSDGAVSQYAVCSENPNGYYNSRFERIDDSLFNVEDEISAYYEGKTFENVPGFLFHPLEGDGMHEKIAKSIYAF